MAQLPWPNAPMDGGSSFENMNILRLNYHPGAVRHWPWPGWVMISIGATAHVFVCSTQAVSS